jgi:hypothetical protein
MDITKCMNCGRSRYVKVVNEDGASVTTKVVVKQLRYMPITPRLKRLYPSEETMKHMRWHREGKCDSEHPDIMSHPTDSEAWEALDLFGPEFQGTLGMSALACLRMVSSLIARPAFPIFASQFSSCLTICHPTNA